MAAEKVQMGRIKELLDIYEATCARGLRDGGRARKAARKAIEEHFKTEAGYTNRYIERFHKAEAEVERLRAALSLLLYRIHQMGVWKDDARRALTEDNTNG